MPDSEPLLDPELAYFFEVDLSTVIARVGLVNKNPAVGGTILDRPSSPRHDTKPLSG